MSVIYSSYLHYYRSPHIVVGLGKIILISENGTIDMSEMKENGKNQDT